MFKDQVIAAISGARSAAALDDLSRLICRGMGEGTWSDDDAQGLAELLHERRQALGATGARPGARPLGARSIYPPRRPQRSPDRQRSIERRRGLAASGPMPPAIASRFTLGEQAVLAVVVGEVARCGVCALHVDAIGARAGVCRRIVQTALRHAEREGLVLIQERRRPGQKNDTNLVRIISREWLAWIEKRARYSTRPASDQGIGCKKMRPTDTQDFHSREKAAVTTRKEVANEPKRARSRSSTRSLICRPHEQQL